MEKNTSTLQRVKNKVSLLWQTSKNSWRLVSLMGGILLSLFAAITTIHPAFADGLTPLPPVTEADGRLGTCYAFYTGPQGERTPQAYQAGSRWDRFDFRWNAMGGEEPGPLNFAPHEEIVTRDRAHGIDIVGILGSTPLWAADCSGVNAAATLPPTKSMPWHPEFTIMWDGDTRHACPPINLNEPWDSPDNYWATYVRDVVTHFKGQVNVWEIWNEPDMRYFWRGSAQDYAQLLKVAYRAAKAANPDATILFGGLAYWEQPNFYIDVLDVLAQDPEASQHNYYFDALSLHLYSNVYQAYDISQQVKIAVQSRVGYHPIWLTETGVPIWDEGPATSPSDYTATAEEAAWQLIEAYANARAAGVEKFFYFRLHDDYTGMGQRFGLTRDDYTLRPSYLAYQVAARYLRGENQITGPFGSTVKRVTFWGTPYGKVDVLWNSTPALLAHTHPAILPTATIVNHRGEKQILTAANGTFDLALLPATNNNHPAGEYIIGGPPVLLIQADTISPTSTLLPISDSSEPGILSLSWDVSDIGSGYWYEEIERASQPEGPWTRVAGIGQTTGITHTEITTPVSGTLYFRARARDRAGNWELWPPTAEISTTANPTRTVALSVTVFSEASPLDNVTMYWKSATEVLTSTVGSSWNVTQTVQPGTYTLSLHHEDHLTKRVTFQVVEGAKTQVLTYTLELHPIVGEIRLPLVLLNHN